MTLHETGELEAIAKATAKNEDQGKFWIKNGGRESVELGDSLHKQLAFRWERREGWEGTFRRREKRLAGHPWSRKGT